ncbi:MAG: TonB-dependent siderophore receptor, partial [Betaproteobacteria bacterium]
METPLAIQVVPQQVLQDQQVLTLDQALVNVSGVRSVNNPYQTKGGQVFYLRGFFARSALRNGAWLSDEDGYGGLGSQTMSNVERVEVMKGPAAILYGRVEPGGIVNIVTKKPKDTPYYSLEQMAGSWDHYVTNAEATGPLNEDKTLLFRVNASYDTQGSWQDAVNSQNTFIAPTLQWKISPQTQVTLEAEYSHNPTAENMLYVPFDSATGQHVPVSRTQNVQHFTTISDKSLLELNWSHEFNDDWKISQRIAHNQAKYTVDGYYANWFVTTHLGDAWTADMIRLGVDNQTTTDAIELNLLGHFDTAGFKHNLLLGADYHSFNNEQMQRASNLAGPVFTQNLLAPTTPSGLTFDSTAYYSSGFKDTHNGVYVQDQIKLPHGIDILAGLRWQKMQLGRDGRAQVGTGLGGDDSISSTPESDFEAVTPRIGLVWQAREGLSFYANYAENFGPNTGKDYLGATLKPQSAKQYEIGEKTELFGGKLTSSLALFELTKTDMGAPDLIHDPAGLFGYQVTVGEIRSRGVEFDIQGEVQTGWNVIASYTYTDIVVSKTTAGSGYVEGNRMPNVPRNMINLFTTYELKGERLHGWKIGGGVTAYDSATDQANTFETPGYAVANAMASYEMKAGGKKTTLQLNINNLFDK